MPNRAPPNQIKSWSWSRYASYSQCPFKAKLTILLKMQEPKNSGMQRGADVHDRVAEYLTGKLKTIPKSVLPKLPPQAKKLREQYARRTKLAARGMAPIVEEEWAYTSKWEVTDWRDWDNCVVRIKLDAGWWPTPTTLRIRDWKTGKFTEKNSREYEEQLELYALAALVRFPHAEEVIPDLCYLDAEVLFPAPQDVNIYTQADVPRLKKAWAQRTRALLADKKFAPRPGWYCAGCYFNKGTEYGWGKDKKPKPAGPCKY